MPHMFPPAFQAFPFLFTQDGNSGYYDGRGRNNEDVMRASRLGRCRRTGVVACPWSRYEVPFQ